MAEGTDNMSIFSSVSTRQRKMTEKGTSYARELKSKDLRKSFRDLKGRQDGILSVLCEALDRETVRQEHSKYLLMLEKHFVLRDEFMNLLEDEDKRDYQAQVEMEESPLILDFKKKIEDWFQENSVEVKESVSQIGKPAHGSQASRTSSVAMARLKEDQRRAELIAKASVLQEMKKLEMDKVRIKMEEKELELKTEMAITEAKTKVIDDYEKSVSGHHSSVTKKLVSRTEHKISCERPDEDPCLTERQEVMGLDPYAAAFIPQHQEQTPLKFDQSSVAQYLRKPVTEMMKFSGDPLDYKRFMRQFHSKILVNTDDVDEIVNYLDQFTTGEANRIVSSYSYMDSDRAYKATLNDFEERYGDTDTIACAFVKKALDWPVIRADSAKALDEYAVFLTECKNAVTSMNAMKILEYPENMKRLVMKLPYQYHDRWRSIVQNVKSGRGSVQFHTLVDFVRKEAKKANDPIYGKKALSVENKSFVVKNQFVKPKTKTFATNVVNDKHRSTAQNGVKKEDDVKKTAEVRNMLGEEPSVHTPKALMDPCIRCGAAQHGLGSCSEWHALTHDVKLDFLMTKGLCFRCMRCGHRSRDCVAKVKCSKCEGNHHTLLHIERFKSQLLPKHGATRETSACASHPGTSMRAGDPECTLSIIPVKIRMRNSCKVIETCAFLDPGSSVSFCSEGMLQKLGCEGKRMKITLDTMGKPHTMITQEVQGLEVCEVGGGTYIQLPKVFSKDKMPVSKCHIPTQQDISKWPHLSDVILPQIHSDIEILIGNNVPDAYSPLQVRTGSRGSPHATRTLLGWVVWNVVRDTDISQNRYSVNSTEIVALEEIEHFRKLECMVIEAINLDFPERVIDDKKEKSQEDQKFAEKVDKSIELVNGHYSIKLPFKKDEVKMPKNQGQALKRLMYLKEKCRRNPKFHGDYKDFMNNILNKGYAEKVPDGDEERPDGKEWYIPHHGIYHPRKPDKIRVVFDCAAIYNGISLNNQLLQGPDLTTNLIGILLRFRQDNVAFMGDIESMFHQVRVPKEDRDFLRFYWWPDGNLQEEPRVYRMAVHLFGAVSSPSCCNAALRKTAQDNKDSFDENVVATIAKSFYVDDCLKSVPSSEQAIQLIQDVCDLCQRGGFRLTKWISNSHEVMNSILPEERAKGAQSLNLDHDQLPAERALGVFWDVERDMLGFRVQLKEHSATKRGILSAVSSIYDPQGFIAPFSLFAKMLLQNLCRLKVNWDDKIEGDNLRKWNQWISDLARIDSIEIPRCYKPATFDHVVKYELHMFSDASDNGYCVVAFLRLVSVRNQIHCVLLFAKARVAPLKRITVPRMELTAATISVRLSRMLLKELEYPITAVFFWTDSMSVIRYVANEKSRFHTFVANRIQVIREASDLSQWKYVNTNSNPADAASRGTRLNKLMDSDSWWYGPEFLWKGEAEWPDQNSVSYSLSDDPEVKRVVATTNVKSTVMDKLLSHFSNWTKLKRAVGWILLVFQELKTRAEKRREVNTKQSHAKAKQKVDKITGKHVTDSESTPTFLTRDLLVGAELAIIRCVQKEHFSEEMKSICQQRHLKSSKLQRLDPVLVEGVIRVGGRLSQAEIPFDAKHPIILPKDSHVSRLIVEHIHKSVGHLGKNRMLTSLRQNYWILGANSLMKTLLHKCVVCRKYQARVLEQKMSDLPSDRVIHGEPPFTHVGMDFFGPILVKRGRGTIKRYGVIFTCLTIRAVHLEVAYSLDTDSCINAIRRFVSRRGPVKTIRSDNGTNLVGSERELREEIDHWNQSKINKELLKKNISWIFNPPAGSHCGGVWERLIRSVRKVLYSILQQQVIRFDDEALHTLFCEVESILNGRPITAVSNEPGDLSPLTPNHLLLLQGGENTPPGLFRKEDTYTKRRWRQIQYLADLFWKRWVCEYLPQLQERQKWTHSRKNVDVGDIVLLVDNTPRNAWTMGRVTEVFPDKKGFVRTVKVKTQSNVLTRPVNKLCLILENDSDLP